MKKRGWTIAKRFLCKRRRVSESRLFKRNRKRRVRRQERRAFLVAEAYGDWDIFIPADRETGEYDLI